MNKRGIAGCLVLALMTINTAYGCGDLDLACKSGINIPVPPLPPLPNCGGAICDGLKHTGDELSNDAKKLGNGADAFTRETEKAAGAIAPALLTGVMVIPGQKQVVDNVIANLDKALKDIASNVDKADKDVERNVSKGLDDTANEAQRAGRNVQDAAQAIGAYGDAVGKGTITSFGRSLERVREGKFVDAAWHLGTDDWKTQSDAAALAATKSTIISTVGALASSVYGGPAGAAAYAAWLTYYQSNGNVDLALRVGILAGATSWALGETGKMPVRDAGGNIIASDLAKKTAVTAAIGGLAVAAAGGDENALKDGFLRAGSMVLIQEGYQSVTAHTLGKDPATGKDGLKASEGPPYCVSETIDCQHIPKDAIVRDPKTNEFLGLEQSKLDPMAPHVGTNFNPDIGQASLGPASEAGPGMIALSKVPGFNAMSVFHDEWGLKWNMQLKGMLVPSIVPAVVLTYNGTTAPLLEEVRKVGMEKAQNMTKSEQNSPMNPVVVTDMAQTPPVRADQIEIAYTCAKQDDTRSIAVEVNTNKGKFACRVIYRANLTRSVPWRSVHDLAYCDSKAKTLVKMQLSLGYSCMVGHPTARRIVANLK